MNMTIHSSIKEKIQAAQNEASKAVNAPAKMLRWIDEQMERMSDGTLYRLTKSAQFIPIRKDYKIDRLARLYLNEIVARHGVPISIISDHDSRFTSRACILNFKGSWDVYLPLVEFSYNNSYHSSVRCTPFKALYGIKCCSLILWAEVGEGQLIGPEIVQETTKKISQIKDRLKATRDH
ncbi:putative reverse transcriptase domain-containing protein [Tanacetum coccineum]